MLCSLSSKYDTSGVGSSLGAYHRDNLSPPPVGTTAVDAISLLIGGVLDVVRDWKHFILQDTAESDVPPDSDPVQHRTDPALLKHPAE